MRKLLSCILILLLVPACSACASILEGDTVLVSPHVEYMKERPQQEKIEVTNYKDIVDALLGLITDHETEILMKASAYTGDINDDIDRAKREIMSGYPIAVFAVTEIDTTVTKIVSSFDISVRIEYKRTKEQVESIINVSTLRYLRTELLKIMSEYREEAFFQTSMQITEEDIAGLVKETYYQNPRSIVMMPVTAVVMFAAGGNETFIELRLWYDMTTDILKQNGATLKGYVGRNANLAEGENDAEILLSLVTNLIGACVFDEGTARTISEYGVQNIKATAYSALVTGNAVGEGFAMAFKALCDELGFDCRIVLGTFNDIIHVWNIVSLYGDYYHIDAAMCALNGIETAFIKTDADFSESYIWDTEKTVSCNGTLTYEEIVGKEEEPGEEGGDEKDDKNGAGTDNPVDGEPGGAAAGTPDSTEETIG